MIRRGGARQTERLRNVVEALPHETRQAMLAGIERYDRIIVGAYTDRQGGVCPMLAAHRCGGRTDFRSFARAWDRFTGAGTRARSASERELRTLRVQLEASLWHDEELRTEIASLHHAHAGRLAAEAKRAAGAQASLAPEARSRMRPGWLIPFRRWDGYEAAVEAALEQQERSQVSGPTSVEQTETPQPAHR